MRLRKKPLSSIHPATVPHGEVLEDLFDRFRRTADAGALARVFDLCAPEVLRVALHFSRDMAGAEDLLQATFLSAIETASGFDRRRQLIPWLLGILANHARMGRRGEERESSRRTVRTRPARDPGDLAEDSEFNESLACAVDGLPKTYRRILVLHLRHGLAAAEIANALGRSPATVRSQIHRGLELVRKALPAGFSLGILGATPARGLAAVRASVLAHAGGLVVPAAVVVGGAFVMKKTLVAGAAVVAAAFAAFASSEILSGDRGPGAPVAPAEPVFAKPSTRTAQHDSREVEGERGESRSRMPAALDESRRDTASLLVRTRWAEDQTPAAGIRIFVQPAITDGVLHMRRITTREDGTALLEGMSPWPVQVYSDRAGSVKAALVAGQRVTTDLEIPLGLQVRGSVVDREGKGIGGARIWLSSGPNEQDDGALVTEASTAGKFRLRSVEPKRMVTASASGFLAGGVQRLDGNPGDEVEVRIELRGPGLPVVLMVVDPSGRPVPGAVVQAGLNSGGTAFSSETPGAPPSSDVTDKDGIFRAEGFVPGWNVNVWVRAAHFAPWSGSVPVLEKHRPPFEVRLARGARFTGRVVDRAGLPCATCFLQIWLASIGPGLGMVYQGPGWANPSVRTDEDGNFAVDGIPPGELRASVEHKEKGRAGRSFEAQDGIEIRWDAVLGGMALKGRVLDAEGSPMSGWRVGAEPLPGFAWGSSKTNADGRFALEGLDDAPYEVCISQPGGAGGEAAIRRSGVRPGPEELQLVVPAEKICSAFLAGRLTLSDGSPPAEAWISCSKSWGSSANAKLDPTTGQIRGGPFPPGTYRVRAAVQGAGIIWSPEVELRAGETTNLGELRLEKAGSILGHIRNADGRLVTAPAASPSLLDHQAGFQRYGVACKFEDGVLKAEGVGPGKYLLEVHGSSVVMTSTVVEVRSGEETKVEVTLPRGVQRTVRFHPPTEPLPVQIDIVWKRNGETWQTWGESRWTASRPWDQAHRLTPGDYEIIAASRSGRRTVTSFSVKDLTPTQEVIEVRLP